MNDQEHYTTAFFDELNKQLVRVALIDRVRTVKVLREWGLS